MLVKRQVRTDEREAARDDRFKLSSVRVGNAKMLGHALAFVVAALEQQRVGCAEVCFRRVQQCCETAVDSAAGCIEQAFRARMTSKLQNASCAVHDGFGQVVCGCVWVRAGGICRCVQHVGVWLGREREAADITFEQGNGRVISDVR